MYDVQDLGAINENIAIRWRLVKEYKVYGDNLQKFQHECGLAGPHFWPKKSCPGLRRFQRLPEKKLGRERKRREKLFVQPFPFLDHLISYPGKKKSFAPHFHSWFVLLGRLSILQLFKFWAAGRKKAVARRNFFNHSSRAWKVTYRIYVLFSEKSRLK